MPDGGQVTGDVDAHLRRLGRAELQQLRSRTIEEAARHVRGDAPPKQVAALVALLDDIDRRLASLDDAARNAAVASVARRQSVAITRRPLHTAGG